MSGAAGGEVGMVAAAAVAAPVLLAAGVAYGVAAGVNFAVDSIASRWQERERLVELQRKQMQIQQGRFEQYNQAVAAFQQAAKLASSMGLPVPDLPLTLTADCPLDELQDAMVRLRTAAARLNREYEAVATVALAEATRAALAHASEAKAHTNEEEIAAGERRVAQAEAAADDHEQQAQHTKRKDHTKTAGPRALVLHRQRIRDRRAVLAAGGRQPGQIALGPGILLASLPADHEQPDHHDQYQHEKGEPSVHCTPPGKCRRGQAAAFAVP